MLNIDKLIESSLFELNQWEPFGNKEEPEQEKEKSSYTVNYIYGSSKITQWVMSKASHEEIETRKIPYDVTRIGNILKFTKIVTGDLYFQLYNNHSGYTLSSRMYIPFEKRTIFSPIIETNRKFKGITFDPHLFKSGNFNVDLEKPLYNSPNPKYSSLYFTGNF